LYDYPICIKKFEPDPESHGRLGRQFTWSAQIINSAGGADEDRMIATFILVAVGGARSMAGAQSQQGEGRVSLERNKVLVRRWIEEGFNKRDLNVIDVVFKENFTVNRSRIGRMGLKQNMTERFRAFPDLRVTIVEIVAEGDKVAMWYTVQGTQNGQFEGVRPTGKPVNWFGADFLRVQGNQIVEGWFVDDSLGLMRQLGVTLSPTHK